MIFDKINKNRKNLSEAFLKLFQSLKNLNSKVPKKHMYPDRNGYFI